ncbi:hypothetical protein R4Z09_25995 [Niallia oryzisoli]|uniref:Uncharacterized protein n=1 Tax=Niallia oryzisoli TaxID=1737571 RepID=A0ABZ2CBZ6_9BACI
MLTFYNPQEGTVKQIKQLCYKADGQLKLFCQIGPTDKALVEKCDEIEIIARVYDNGNLIFDSSLLLGTSLGKNRPVGQRISPLDERKQILHRNLSDPSIVHSKSLIYFIECEEYNKFVEEISKLLLLTAYRSFKYFQNHEEQFAEQLNFVKQAVKEIKEKESKPYSPSGHHL